MHFKSLELLGFKSFADKTRLEFEPGVTAIVGPNGCGKSNIGDAIRWVLGEQSARLLRGLKMEDVIFNGTDARKPLGLAEVSLTLTGVDEALSVAYHELTITRRVLRSGEGLYFINRQPCRLKDINELLMGTGIGLSAYSIIEQGNIDMILSSKPEDRRYIFEEAAGITKYKEKKKEALRRLASTEENLVRLNDIIGEVTRQLATVERQAERARESQKITEELTHLELQVSAHQFAALRKKLSATEQKLAAGKEKERDARSAINKLETTQETLRKKLFDLDRELSTAQAKRVGVAGSIDGFANRIEANERLIRELLENDSRLSLEINELNSALEETRKDKEHYAAQQEKESQEKKRAVAELQSVEEELSKTQHLLHETEQELSACKDELIERMNKAARLGNEQTSLRNELRQTELRKTRLQVEQKEIAEKLREALKEVAKKQALRDDLQRTTTARKDIAAGKREEFAEARKKEAESAILLREKEKSLAQCDSRLTLLQQQKAHYDGYADGVKLIMSEIERRRETLGGIQGVVAECFNVPGEFEVAVEAALGNRLHHLVALSKKEALAALSFLEGNADVAILPVDNVASTPDIDLPEGKGIIGPLITLIGFDSSLEGAARYFFSGVVVVDSRENAISLMDECPPGTTLVTPQGDLFQVGGEFRKISRRQGATPLISREKEIARLISQKEKLVDECEALTRTRTDCVDSCRTLEEAVHETQNAVHKQEIALAEARREEERCAEIRDQLETGRGTVDQELKELETAQHRAHERLKAIVKEISSAEERAGELKVSLGTHQEKVAQLEEAQRLLHTKVTELKVSCATVSGSEQNARAALERASSNLTRLETELSSKKAQQSQMREKRESLLKEIDGLKKSIEGLSAERETSDVDVKTREDEKSAIYEKLSGSEERFKEALTRLERVKDDVSQIEIQLAEQRAKRENLLERVWENYEKNLEDVQLDESIEDWANVRATIDRHKATLRRIGPANMVALEEHRELKERYDFLTEQQEDLLNAKSSLQHALDKINEETTRMFSETFSAVRENFREIFKELFEGGTANLLLEEGNDILEAGINIVARPPGKKLQNISLLSGGERALTAIALLFAILKVRPSPFYILDEIDAPLDESNINRFLKLLERFLEKSQFIIITHNKRTISMADIMYGITMEESGVSKVVSVKFAGQEETV